MHHDGPDRVGAELARPPLHLDVAEPVEREPGLPGLRAVAAERVLASLAVGAVEVERLVDEDRDFARPFEFDEAIRVYVGGRWVAAAEVRQAGDVANFAIAKSRDD